MVSRKEHWEKVYSSKEPNEVSWTQETPTLSLDFIQSFQLPKTASIIDVGGGDSRLVDNLLMKGFENITVLDISEHAIERAKHRLSSQADKVNWVVSDITQFNPTITYDCWHDRATFHFLLSAKDIENYIIKARQAVNKFMVIGTFSEHGPHTCSALPVKQYKEETIQELLHDGFEKIKCVSEEHITPFKTSQNFLFCSFKRNKSFH